MPILFTTYGLLLIFAIFGFAQLRVYKNNFFTELLVAENFTKMRNELTDFLEQKSKNEYNKRKPKKVAPKPDDKNDDEEEEDEEESKNEPDNLDEPDAPKKRLSHLSVNILFCEEDVSVLEGKGKSCFHLLKALMTSMYEGQEFFEEAKNHHPDLVDTLISTLMEKCQDRIKEGKKPYRVAKDLLRIDLEDDTLNYVFYKMMRGSKTLGKSAYDAPGYFSLDTIITLQGKKDKIMSLWLAPKPLLVALFDNEVMADEVVDARNEMYQDRRKRKIISSSKDTTTTSLESRYKTAIFAVDPNCIDFITSTTKPPAY
jgi:hypothetical protein